METESVRDLATALLQLSGAFLFFASAVALWRLPDLASRVHGPTKAASLGIALFAAGLALHRFDPRWLLQIVLLVFFVFATVPLSTQVLLSANRWRESEEPRSTEPSEHPGRPEPSPDDRRKD